MLFFIKKCQKEQKLVQIGSTLEFRARRKAFLQNKLDFKTEKTVLWEYINALIYFFRTRLFNLFYTNH